jgi:hypothetical protein
LSKDEFDALPPSIIVREIYYYIVIPGFRTQQVSLTTTLLNNVSEFIAMKLKVIAHKAVPDRPGRSIILKLRHDQESSDR